VEAGSSRSAFARSVIDNAVPTVSTFPWLPLLDGLSEQPLSRRREVLRRIVQQVMESERTGGTLDDAAFLALALEVFRYQAHANTAYGTWVQRRGVDPRRAEALSDILPVPARAFKDLRMLADGSPVEATFRTSGTTGGAERRGIHFVRDLDLYRMSILTTASNTLLSEPGYNRNSIRVLSLTPGPGVAPDSSLVHMFHIWIDAWDDRGGGFFGGTSWEPKTGELRAAIGRAVGEGLPVLLVGTAFSFVRWLDALPSGHPELPPGSIVVETGGFKGRSRVVPRGELYRALSATTGVSVARIVNEYGMTELLSQFYEPVLSGEAPEDPDRRWHVGPSWVRTRILDPETLDAVDPGEPGLLCHVDLANLDSAVAVLTEDVGFQPHELAAARPTSRAFRLLGRGQGAEPRGCSLVMEELLGVAGPAADR